MKKIIILIILMTLSLNFLSFADNRTNSENLANTLGKDIQETIGNKDDLNQKLYKPLTSEVKMNTLKQTYKCSVDNKVYTSNTECFQNCSGICSLNDFNAQIQCQSYIDGLILQALPGGGGELRGIIVKIDENFDKQYETVFQTNNISGICDNGYVSCNQGTWNNCKFIEFGIPHKCQGSGVNYVSYNECKNGCATHDCIPIGSIQEIERTYAQMDKLGNCYCTNASCGMNAINLINNVFSFIGGSVVAHLSGEKGLVVTDSNIDVTTLSAKYLVSDIVSCYGSNEKVESLKHSYKTKILDGSSEVLNQSSNPNSYYSLVTSDKSTNIKTCTIKNTPYAANLRTLTDYRCDNPISLNGRYYCKVFDIPDSQGSYGVRGEEFFDENCETKTVCEKDYDGTTYCHEEVVCTNVSLGLWVRTGDHGISYTFSNLPHPGSNGHKYEYFEHLFRIQKGFEYSDGKCSVNYTVNSPHKTNYSSKYPQNTTSVGCYFGQWFNFYNETFNNTVVKEGTMSLKVQTGDWTARGDWEYSRLQMYITYDPKYKYEDLLVQESNGCLSYMSDPNCSLLEEKVNDIYQTVYGGTTQTLNIPQQCMDVHGQLDVYRVCEGGNRFYKYDPLTAQANDIKTYQDNIGYFKITRKYECSTEKQEFDFTKAKKNANLIGETYDKTSGDFQYLKEDEIVSGNIKLDYDDEISSCILSCDVIVSQTPDTVIFPDNTLRPDTSHNNIDTRECVIDKVNNSPVCPTKNGEIVQRSCECINKFSESIGVLAGVFQASKDMICSSQ